MCSNNVLVNALSRPREYGNAKTEAHHHRTSRKVRQDDIRKSDWENLVVHVIKTGRSGRARTSVSMDYIVANDIASCRSEIM
jgi:hypothetical protein